MQVKHRLPAISVRVDHDPVARRRKSLGDRHIPDVQKQASQQVRVLGLIQRRHVVLGNYEHMGRRLRVNVSERKEPIGLVDLV